MREILFRGKRIDNGEWVEGFYNHIPCGRFLCDEHCIQTIKQDGRIGQLYDVYDSTVEQFTELTDRNGVKVFDGDILKFTDLNAEYEWIGRVEFGNPNEEYNWGFQLVFIKGEKPNTDILLWFDMEETGAFSEVIGNIHDNPELLEVEDGNT